jgi:hypothetical protein
MRIFNAIPLTIRRMHSSEFLGSNRNAPSIRKYGQHIDFFKLIFKIIPGQLRAIILLVQKDISLWI